MRLGRVLLIASALACSGIVNADGLVNPGFEEVDLAGRPAAWQVYSGLDPNGYGRPDFKATFDEVVPKQAAGGHGGSTYCAGYPREGTWQGGINDHFDPGGNGSVDGRQLGKAALSQTIILEPGAYVFGAYLRTADGGGYTGAFSLGYNHGPPANYANDDSTGIRWTAHDLALKTSFEDIGFLTERGEWYKYQTEPFEVKKRGSVTVWIRFNYVNNNSMPTRWQVDDAFIAPCKGIESGEQKVEVKATAGSPLRYPLPGMLVADCADDTEKYLLDGGGSTISDNVPKRIFQHSRCVTGNASFSYSFPIDAKQNVVYLAFEHTGPCKVTIGGRVVRTDSDALEEKLYPKEYVLTDRSLWKSGNLNVKFESADAAKTLGVAWIEAGTSTRFRERLNFVEWDTTSIPWRIGLWDASCNEFRGSDRTCVIGKTNPAVLNTDDMRIEWKQKVKPGYRYYLVLGYYRNGREEVRGYVDIGDDGVVEMVDKTLGHEAFDYDITEYLKDGRNVVSVKAKSIDFVALVETLPGIMDNRKLGLYFGGDELAENLTRVYHNSMFWILNMHYDYTGFIDASIPYGKWWHQYWPIDIAMAVRSLLYWGYLDQADTALRLVAEIMWKGHSSNRSGGSDNNGGNILATDMCELIRRRGFEKGAVDALWSQVSSYSDQVCADVERSPFGLMKGTNWENAGNREQGPCYALSTNLMACHMLLKAADTADEGKLAGDARQWRDTALKIREHVLQKLVFKEDVISPTGWVFPKGTWAYGIMDDGSYMLQPLAGYLWAGKMGAGYHGFIDPDKEIRRLFDLTEDAALPLVGRESGKGNRPVSGYAYSYDNDETLFASSALSDKVDYMSQVLPQKKRQTDYDDDIGSQKAEVSRWAYGSPNEIEDTNLVCVSEYLDCPRFIIGVDDLLYQGAQLRIIPRLPTRWNECGVNDWGVQYLKDGKRAATSLTYNYKLTEGVATLRVSTKDQVKGIRLRLGPFPEDIHALVASVDSRPVPTVSEKSGGTLWCWVETDTGQNEREIVVRAR